MIVTTDDVCLENLKYFRCWDKVKNEIPNLRLIAFVIANYKGKQNVFESREFKLWFEKHKDWVEVGVHGYDHTFPPEQERDNAEACITQSLDILRPFLPKQFLYRPPGFQSSIRTEPMLRQLGFAGVAYQTRIKMFDGRILEPIFNTHCCDKHINPITQWKDWINQILETQ